MTTTCPDNFETIATVAVNIADGVIAVFAEDFGVNITARHAVNIAMAAARAASVEGAGGTPNLRPLTELVAARLDRPTFARLGAAVQSILAMAIVEEGNVLGE